MECPSPTDLSECAMMRERSVAGLSDDIPSCPVHGEWSDEDMDMRGCGVDDTSHETRCPNIPREADDDGENA